MKKIVTALFIMFFGLSSSAETVYEFNMGADYIFFSENSVKSVMSNKKGTESGTFLCGWKT